MNEKNLKDLGIVDYDCEYWHGIDIRDFRSLSSKEMPYDDAVVELERICAAITKWYKETYKVGKTIATPYGEGEVVEVVIFGKNINSIRPIVHFDPLPDQYSYTMFPNGNFSTARHHHDLFISHKS